MGSITTAFPTSEKGELPSAAHCFLATVTPTATTSNTSTAVTAVSSLAGIAVGMAVTGTGIAAGTVIAAIGASNTLTLSIAATASNSGVTLTISGDIFKMALIIPSPTGTYGAATTNYSNITGNSDEVASGGGYTTGGQALTANISPATSGTGAYWSWTTNPSWTSATFSTAGCEVHNTNGRLAGVTGRSVYVGSFGGTQTVAAGTFTVILPSNAVSTSILQLN